MTWTIANDCLTPLSDDAYFRAFQLKYCGQLADEVEVNMGSHLYRIICEVGW